MKTELAPPAGHHLLQFYVETETLARNVASYFADGLRRGERALLVATPEHAAAITEKLSERGVDLDGFTRLDARETLERICSENRPDERLFEEILGRLIRDTISASRGFGLRVFGEMVDLLWRDGRGEDAAALENMWNRLLERQRFSLYCAYALDLFAPGSRVPALTTHTQLLPTGVDGQLERAVERAMRDTLGAEAVDALLPLIRATLHPRALRPGPEATLLWVRNHLPDVAAEVLARSRAGFLSGRDAG